MDFAESSAFSLSLRVSAETAPSRREPLSVLLLNFSFAACWYSCKEKTKGSLWEGAGFVKL